MDNVGSINANLEDTSNARGNPSEGEKANGHAKIDTISGAAHAAVDSLSAGTHAGFDKAVDVAKQAAETLETKQAELKVVQVKFLEDSRSYVQQNPLMSVGIAAAVGYFLSRLLKSH